VSIVNYVFGQRALLFAHFLNGAISNRDGPSCFTPVCALCNQSNDNRDDPDVKRSFPHASPICNRHIVTFLIGFAFLLQPEGAIYPVHYLHETDSSPGRGVFGKLGIFDGTIKDAEVSKQGYNLQEGKLQDTIFTACVHNKE
jgi:hypothetical protein